MIFIKELYDIVSKSNDVFYEAFFFVLFFFLVLLCFISFSVYFFHILFPTEIHMTYCTKLYFIEK